MDGGRNYGTCYCGKTMSAHINVSKPLPRHKFIAVEGAELQRGLEVAVERERERLDGPDDNSEEPGGQIGQTDDF